MNKKIFFLLIIFLLSISIVNAVEEYGLYEIDNNEILNTTFSNSDVSHLRDNYYGVVYNDGSNNGILRVIEVDNNNNLINSSVDTWNFGSSAFYPKIENFNSVDGVSVIAYQDNGGSSDIIFKSFDVYNNGTVRSLDSDYITSLVVADNIDMFKIDSEHFLVAGISDNYKERMNMMIYTVSNSSGTLSTSDSGPTFCIDNDAYDSARDMSVLKLDNRCYIFYREHNLKRGYYENVGCTNTYVNGGSSSAGSCTVASSYSTQFEANEVNYVDADVDTDGGFIYIVYSETIDKHPVLMVMNSTRDIVDKLRFNEETVTSMSVRTISQQNVVVSYSTSSGLFIKTFSIDNDGQITEVYEEQFSNDGYDASLDFLASGDEYISSYSASGHLLSFGAGIIPPPGPDDTQIVIKDEKTLGALDLTDLNLTFYAYCDDNVAYETDITNTTESIPVTCNYTGFAIKVNYLNYLNITESYTRYYLRNLDDAYEAFNLDVYLINPYTTDFVTTNVIVDDLTNVYTNTSVHFEKNINGTTTQITAFDLDLEEKMRAVLMTDEIYYAYLDSDVTRKEFLGKYISASAGTIEDYKVFHLYDIQMRPDYTNLYNKINYQVYTEDYQIEYTVKTPELIDANIINVTFQLYNGSVNDTLIYNESTGSVYDPLLLYSIISGGTFNYSSYENETVTARLKIFFVDDGTILQTEYVTGLWYGSEKLKLPLMDYVSEEFMDWFLIILLSIVSLYATIKTANMAALAVIGFASLFVIFGWFNVGIGVLALATMIALINLLANNNG